MSKYYCDDYDDSDDGGDNDKNEGYLFNEYCDNCRQPRTFEQQNNAEWQCVFCGYAIRFY